MKTVKTPPARVIADREAADTMTAHGRRIDTGTELTVAGIRGRCAFVRYVRHESGADWLDVVTSRGFSRTVRPQMIKTVHRTKTGIRA